MHLWEHLGEAARVHRANPMRTLLTMLGVMIGVGALITTLSVGAGAQATVIEQIRSLGASVLMVTPRAERRTPPARVGPVRPAGLTVSDVEAITAAVPEVSAVAPALRGRGTLVHGNRSRSTRVNGTTADYFFIRDWPLAAGRAFSRREQQDAGKVAVIGATVAEQLFGAADPVGRQVRLLNAPMRVIGVLAGKGPSGSGRDQDDIVFVPYRTALLRLGTGDRRLNPDSVSYILAKAASDRAMPQTKTRIEATLRQRHPAPPDAEAGYRVADPAATMMAQHGATRTIARLLAAIASISLVIGGISIMNIMLVSVTERTREIGLRRALGARRRDITRLFLAEAVLICALGGLLGLAGGVGASWLIAELAGWSILVAPGAILLALISSVSVGLLFGYFPARKAAALVPAVALRKE